MHGYMAKHIASQKKTLDFVLLCETIISGSETVLRHYIASHVNAKDAQFVFGVQMYKPLQKRGLNWRNLFVILQVSSEAKTVDFPFDRLYS